MVRIFHFFSEEPKYYYTVLEHLEGGDLLDHIAEKVQMSTSACSLYLLTFWWSARKIDTASPEALPLVPPPFRIPPPPFETLKQWYP